MDVVIDTNAWLKIVMMIAHFVPFRLQRLQDVVTDKAITFIVKRQKGVIFEPLWLGGTEEDSK